MWYNGTGLWRVCNGCRGYCTSVVQVVEKLKGRGLVLQSSRIEDTPPPRSCSVYVGFDPTADSLHTGNLLAIIALIHFQRDGFQPIAVIGGATGLVGDPSGRIKERESLSLKSLEINLCGLKENLNRIFHNENSFFNHGSSNRLPLKIFNNADWWSEVGSVEFVSNIARHFRLGSMLSKESVKQRLQPDEGMTCAEFLYPIFQGYDFLHLNRHSNCWIQVGGGDQWGNITTGIEFVRRASGNNVHGITLPLLTAEDGEKLGKSAGNAVWLSPEKTSPYHFYQHFVQSTDQQVEWLLKLFTFLELGKIQEIMKKHEKTPERYEAQKCLAENITRLVHGEVGVQKAKNATSVLFGDRDALTKLTGTEMEQLFKDAPCHEIPFDSGHGKRLVEIMHLTNIFSCIEEAESMVRKRGLYVNSVRVQSTEEEFDQERHVLAGNTTVIRIGKKNYKLIKWKH